MARQQPSLSGTTSCMPPFQHPASAAPAGTWTATAASADPSGPATRPAPPAPPAACPRSTPRSRSPSQPRPAPPSPRMPTPPPPGGGCRTGVAARDPPPGIPADSGNCAGQRCHRSRHQFRRAGQMWHGRQRGSRDRNGMFGQIRSYRDLVARSRPTGRCGHMVTTRALQPAASQHLGMITALSAGGDKRGREDDRGSRTGAHWHRPRRTRQGSVTVRRRPGRRSSGRFSGDEPGLAGGRTALPG